MKTIFDYLIVSVIAILMAWVGYWLMGRYNAGNQHFLEFHDVGWTVWLSAVSVVTWVYLYRMCHRLHWLVLPVMGIFSPIIGALLFVIPFSFFPFIILWVYAPVIFPVGIATGFLVSLATLPFRPRGVWLGNV